MTRSLLYQIIQIFRPSQLLKILGHVILSVQMDSLHAQHVQILVVLEILHYEKVRSRYIEQSFR